MAQRLLFTAIVIFFVAMNVMLYRSEFGSRHKITSTIPADKVWEKVFTAPDNSSLDVIHHGKKIGYCRWSVNSGDPVATGKVLSEDYSPDDTQPTVSNYTLDLEGNVFVESISNNVRFELSLTLTTNQTWQDFRVRASLRPDSWEVSSRAGEDKIRLLVHDESGSWEQEYSLSDLQNPELLAKEFGGPVALALIGGLGLRPSTSPQAPKLTLGLNWEAHHDSMRFGQSKVRVYRLEAKLLDRFKIFIFVSRVGEILWVHLPDDLVLSNDAFSHF